MLKLRTFIDLRAILHPLCPSTNRPSTRSNVIHLLSSPPFLSSTQFRPACMWVSLRYGGLFFPSFFAAWARVTAVHCMHELSSRCNWWARLFPQPSIHIHHSAPRSAAVNESGLIFLCLLHTALNIGDEINQETKGSFKVLLHLLFTFIWLPANLLL